MELDPEVQAFKKANRGPIWMWIGGIAGAIVLGGLYSVSASGAVRSDLETEGYTDISVKIKGPFEYAFTANKSVGFGDSAHKSHCEGHVSRKPFSSTRDEMCIEESRPGPPKPPPRPKGEVIAADLQKLMTDQGMAVTVHCPVVAPDAVQLTCTVTASEGPPLEMQLAKDGDDWTAKKPSHLIDRKRMSDDIAKELGDKAKSTATVDCGVGLLGFEADDHTTCTAKLKSSSKDAHVEVTFNDKGGYNWKTNI